MKKYTLVNQPFLGVVGAAIQDRRRVCGLSQEDLAEQSGIHRNTLGRIERGECDTSIIALSRLYFPLGSAGVRVERTGIIPFCHEGVSYATTPGIADMLPSTMIRLLATAIHDRRVKMGMSMQRTADLSKIHINSLWNFETSLVCPTITTYYNLLRTLEVSAVTLSNGAPLLW